jgi:hypothetical protein
MVAGGCCVDGLKDGLVIELFKLFRSVWGIDVQKLQTGSQ